ncbi:hypothetical protein CTAM01_05481 [Colletotrichum tamarilloi]|uniref:Uncharacterized protein n=1 Tax=Colletotrichum tamarilloi TaxID=1209934 RepID=A0ABQ9REE8_9PEZI|nr:uncharacterized protein CTAM01_05481 [Colletotrichum tamarilloi]KAK1502043.1 hypothetical protein CTAM01_05481 [Colletotrichum tamarilloi]
MPRPSFAEDAQEPDTPQVATPTTQPVYSDASSSYWPPGWNYNRYRHATADDVTSLPVDELLKMQAGLRDVLGEEGVGQLAMHVFEEQQRDAERTGDESTAETAKKSEVEHMPPNWLKHWQQRHEGQTWGMVAFRTACYDDQERWETFAKQVRRIVEIPFQRDADGADVHEYFKDAESKFEIRWVEDPALAGATADDLRDKFGNMKSELPAGFSEQVFLVATSAVIASVLDLGEGDQPTTKSKWWRTSAPFFLAVAADTDPGLEEGHEEREWFKPIFKVAAETIVEEFWWLLDSDIMPLRRITRSVRGLEGLADTETGTSGSEDLEKVWWSTAPSPERMRKRRRF